MARRMLLLGLLVMMLGNAIPSQAGIYNRKYFITNNTRYSR